MSEHDLAPNKRPDSALVSKSPPVSSQSTPSPQASMLNLQRSAGNRAVAGAMTQAPAVSQREQMWHNLAMAVDAGRYEQAAIILNGFNDADMERMVKQVHPMHWQRLRSAAVKAMPGWSSRVVEAIDKIASDIEEQRHKQERANEAVARTAVGIAVLRTAVSPTTTPPIDWAGGNLRGLGAEEPVLNLYYPGATRLPRNYPGVDYILGGTRTPLTGTWKVSAGNLPLTADSAAIQGGTLIQLKTLKGSEAFYAENPENIYSTLSSQMEKLANVKPGAGRSENIGGEVFRIMHSGAAERKIFRIELDQAPTAEQLAQFEKLKEAGRSYGQFGKGEEIEVVVNWPGKGVLLKPAVVGGIAVVLAGLSMYSREKWREHQLEDEGYAPPGLAAHENDSWPVRLGAFFRGDQLESQMGGPGAVNMPVWRAHIRANAAKVSPGGDLAITWQRASPMGGTEDLRVVYQKQSDGSWKAGPGQNTPGFSPPDLNRILDPNETDAAIQAMIGIATGEFPT